MNCTKIKNKKIKIILKHLKAMYRLSQIVVWIKNTSFSQMSQRLQKSLSMKLHGWNDGRCCSLMGEKLSQIDLCSQSTKYKQTVMPRTFESNYTSLEMRLHLGHYHASVVGVSWNYFAIDVSGRECNCCTKHFIHFLMLMNYLVYDFELQSKT